MTTPEVTDPAVLAQSEYGLAFALLAQMQVDLSDTRGGLPSTCVVYPGTTDPPMYECPEMAWVVVQSMRPHDGDAPFGQMVRPGRSLPGWMVNLRAGVYRTFPVKDKHAMPAAVVLDSLTRDEADDRLALVQAVSLNPYWQQAEAWAIVGTARGLAVQGGRHGVSLDVQVFMPSLCSSPDAVFPKFAGDPRLK